MADTREAPPALDYDPADVERIQQLLDALQATADPDERSRIKQQLADLTFRS
ncbi:MAG: hypothetical protein JO307_32415 [Bryobacterales bacterium]|nr:hypothetical protein [Bryobacterales bacterium]